jgi:peroxiredoxin Q/BCP
LRDDWSEFENVGLSVYGVSYDTPEANLAFADKNRLPFRLLSDSDRSLAASLGARSRLLPVPKRISYLVGADGVILKTYPKVSPASHSRDVLRDFQQIPERR